jgi:uncharacterized protein YpmS
MLMTKKKRSFYLFLALAALILASLACSLPGGGRPEGTPIPVTTESVEQLRENLEQAAKQAADTGEVDVVIDEPQMTSLVAFELEKQQDFNMTNPQVLLRDGQVQIYADFQQSGVVVPLAIKLNVSTDGQGNPRYDVVEATAGPLPLPDSIVAQLEAQLDAAIASRLSNNGQPLYVDSITVADGTMNIQAHTR